MAERALLTRTKIQDAINNRCEQMKGCTSKMLDSILERHKGKVAIDRVQVAAGDNAVNEQDPSVVKETVAAHFKDWHGPRRILPLEDQPRWKAQYEPKDWIDPAWYQGLMSPPTQEEFKAAISNSPIRKAPGHSGVSNDLFMRQGDL
ncbi:hypothetical protein BGX21_007136, partial [Mortierella sp. AD011]